MRYDQVRGKELPVRPVNIAMHPRIPVTIFWTGHRPEDNIRRAATELTDS